MRKIVFVIIVLIAYSAHAQVVSGSIVILNFTKDKVVVAADSLAGNSDTGIPDYSHCKLAALGHQFIFTSVGNAGWSSSGKIIWDNLDLAKGAVRDAKKRKDGNIEMDDVINLWARGVKSHWNMVNRKTASDISAANKGQITAGVFIGKELTMKVAVLYFDGSNLFDPIQYAISDSSGDCWPCGQLQGEKVCGAGAHLDVAAKFCSGRKYGDKILVDTYLRGASESTKLAVKIVEMTIAAYGKTAKNVGGAVDTVTISRNGRITWNSRKANCHDN